MSGGYIVIMITVLLSFGVFLDDWFTTEKQKDWMRRKLIGLYLCLGVDASKHEPPQPQHKFKLLSWYFLDDWIGIFIFLAIPLGFDMVETWNEKGFSISILDYLATGILYLMAIIYSFFAFRWFLYATKPGLGRVTVAVLLSVIAGGVAYDLLDSDFQGQSWTLLVAEDVAAIFLVCFFVLAMVVSLLELPLLFGKSVNVVLYHSISAATSPQKSPFKFLASLLLILFAAIKGLFF